jgi:hypothetical protein
MQSQMRPDIYGLDQAITNLLKGASEVADSPIPRNHTVANKLVMMHARRPVIAHVAARKTKSPREPLSEFGPQPCRSQQRAKTPMASGFSHGAILLFVRWTPRNYRSLPPPVGQKKHCLRGLLRCNRWGC